MTDTSSNRADSGARHGIFTWMLFPLALFPLMALLTYDWHAIETLNTPPMRSANWIGALGDYFAYYGYQVFGLTVWIVPIICVVFAIMTIRGRKVRPGKCGLWLLVFLVTVSCLMQVTGANLALVASIVRHNNLMCAGGWIGYLMMTRFLSPVISDFGSAVIMAILMVVSLVATIGLDNIVRFLGGLYSWALANREPTSPIRNPHDEQDADDRLAQCEAIRAAREAARQAAKDEKDRIRAEKLAAKQAAKEAKERLKAEKVAAKKARQDANGRISMWNRGDEPLLPDPAGNPPPTRPATAAKNGQNGASADEESPDKGPYVLPSVALLNPLKKSTADHGDVGEMSQKLIDTLKLFGVDATLAYTVQGPVVTKYALKLVPGIRYSAVTNVSDNLMGALHAKSLRIEAPIPGDECVGIEVPNRTPVGISFREIIESSAWKNFHGELPLLFGKDAAGKELIADLAAMPHMLVAGATGQGKSVCLNAIINGLLMTKTPDQLKLIMVDPKSVEFSSYATLPHLIVPVITENKKVVFSLHWAVAEMEKRLKLFARTHVKNIYDFNHRQSYTQQDMFGDDTEIESSMPKKLHYIVIIIDEVADLMATNGKEVVPDIARLTAKARATGIHLILATQRPDAKVITGTIKANIPGRVAFKTAQAVDSRTILDEAGAENLIGKGDMLFRGKDGMLTRAQGAWIGDDEIARVIHFIEQHSNVQFDERFAKKLGTIKDEEVDLYDEPTDSDDAKAAAKAAAESQREQVKAENNASDFKKAVECVINTNRASISHFQRRLGWGYNHAANIIDMLEDAGVIGPQTGAGPRSIIMDQQQLLDIFNGNGATAAEGDAADDAAPDDDRTATSDDNDQSETEDNA